MLAGRIHITEKGYAAPGSANSDAADEDAEGWGISSQSARARGKLMGLELGAKQSQARRGKCEESGDRTAHNRGCWIATHVTAPRALSAAAAPEFHPLAMRKEDALKGENIAKPPFNFTASIGERPDWMETISGTNRMDSAASPWQ